MADRYLILSDFHLCDTEEHSDGWRYFKSARYHIDQPFADLIRYFESEAGADDLNKVVFNGDVFDFDLVTALPDDPPFKVTRIERRRGLDPTPEKSVWKLGRILETHPVFVDALADFLADGGELVYVLGNHDREMCFEAVQRAFIATLRDNAAQRGRCWDGNGISFEPWFYHVPGVLFAEHGHQYDPFAAYRHILSPVVIINGEEHLALPMGNLSNRTLLSKMWRFNPFAGDYINSFLGYILHWFRYYALSRRSLVINWLWGSLLVFFMLQRTRRRESEAPEPTEGLLTQLADRVNMSMEQLGALAELHCRPIYERSYRVARELWLDRLAIVMLVAATTCGLALTPLPLWAKIAVPLLVFPLAYVIYESIAGRETVFDVRSRIPERAAEISDLLDVPLVTFGHDHVPRMIALGGGGSFADSGTWAPITEGKGSLSPGYRNYVMVSDAGGQREVRFDSWPF